ncbi:signal recognition particle subunit SRP68-like isoform X2 [Pongo abelii]|uniref:signal recognition particle subunit SRP68-like isoform X2 n=1 Tax=Pongo abelii TaxID=9601 RepID=UPI00300560EB
MAIKRNESMAKGLHRALLQQHPEDDSKCSPRPQDLIRLYDIILQLTLEDQEESCGIAPASWFRGRQSLPERDRPLKILVFEAYRCFFIAQSYALVKKWSEALVLHDSILKYADEVNSDAGTFKNSLKDLPDMQELITEVWSEKCSLQAAAILASG